MILERKNNEILVRLSTQLDAATIQDVLDFLKYQENTIASKAKQSAVDKLAGEVNKSMWEEFKKQRRL